MEALNPVQAAVGDRVVCRRGGVSLLRNVGSLMGLPVLVLVLGWVVSLFIGTAELLGVPVTFLCMFCSLPLGVAGGVFLYRYWSRENLPTIIRIIRTRHEMASSFAGAQEPTREIDGFLI